MDLEEELALNATWQAGASTTSLKRSKKKRLRGKARAGFTILSMPTQPAGASGASGAGRAGAGGAQPRRKKAARAPFSSGTNVSGNARGGRVRQIPQRRDAPARAPTHHYAFRRVWMGRE